MRVPLLAFFQLYLVTVFCQTYSVLLKWSKREKFDRITVTLNTVLRGTCHTIDQSYAVERKQGSLAVAVRLPSEIVKITAYNSEHRPSRAYIGTFSAPSDTTLHQVITVIFQQ